MGVCVRPPKCPEWLPCPPLAHKPCHTKQGIQAQKGTPHVEYGMSQKRRRLWKWPGLHGGVQAAPGNTEEGARLALPADSPARSGAGPVGEWRAGWASAVHTGGALRAPMGLGCGGPESPPRRSGWNLTTWYSAAGSDG
ncbi:unnamed protein product [Rangifer tarandus platyrhynchus]|uniref:Uncharacterized protein n=2 Tax=Rangifer tarandus platyrhynchus TaxID=3082113 RepID=A0ABN8XVJ5_RANTA|nr:unnamed protein product [Rangifer tarandus platyrhynchus]CAI9690197.1 unnamed protein product [Rangifer tarandus platyrhynchus]